MSRVDVLAKLELFYDLTEEQRSTILKMMKRRKIVRGHSLVVEGEPSDSLFIVLHGAFEVRRSDISPPIAQIRAGAVIGEIGFFAETTRTATVKAIRDAMVLELDRAAYEQVVLKAPSIQATLLNAMARRLNDTSARLTPRQDPPLARTVAVLQGGSEPVPPLFWGLLRGSLAAAGSRIIDRKAIEARFGSFNPDDDDLRLWLNALEWEENLVVYIADPDLTDWTRKCVRQADMAVIVVCGEAPNGPLTPVETFVCEVHGVMTRRLAVVHDRRSNFVSGTRAWLRRMEVYLHHHLSLEDADDFQALVRFLTGRALGFVAGGGGAFGTAHLGIYKAFLEKGITFDIFIGTSIGAAVLAGFAIRYTPERVDEGMQDIFSVNRAFKRPTVPKYALLDHKVFDAALERNYGAGVQVEDCWHPYFAVATNLSCQQLELIRTGPLWKAVRASASIPGILPPVYTEDGSMLVDGGVMDNAPLGPLKSLKAGPNLIVHFGRRGEQRFQCRYEEIPGRGELITAMLNPFRRRRLPRAPGAASVLIRSMMVHQRYDLPTEPQDLVLQPPPFPGSSFMNFDRHSEVFQDSYRWALEKIDELKQRKDPALAAIMTSPTANADPSNWERGSIKMVGKQR